MLIQYKRNKRPVCYTSNCPASAGGITSPPRPSGPFESCGDCPYAAHGFLCYSREGDCMKTDLEHLRKRNKGAVKREPPEQGMTMEGMSE